MSRTRKRPGAKDRNKLKARLFHFQDKKCCLCFEEMPPIGEISDRMPSIEHVVPASTCKAFPDRRCSTNELMLSHLDCNNKRKVAPLTDEQAAFFALVTIRRLFHKHPDGVKDPSRWVDIDECIADCDRYLNLNEDEVFG